jgi:diguanylate cyclase (GGDEF)-like protein
MDQRVLLLRELMKEGTKLLKPRISLESFYGYYYPEAQAAFKTRPGEEIEPLNHLVKLGYLDRLFFDKIHLCPFCAHFAINFREACPQCRSADVDIVEMLHHFRCGAVAPETEFRQGIRLCCPKCNRALRHIGVDYERPTSNYLCASCKHIFSEPQVSCLSLKCGQLFEIEKVVTQTISTYRLTAKGTLAATQGVIEEEGLSAAFIDTDFSIYTFSYFKERLAQEIPRASRYQRPLSIVLASPDHLEAFAERFGREATAAFLKAIALIVKESLRDFDVPSLYGDTTLALLLPDTPLEGAYIAVDRIRKKILELNPPEQELKVTLSAGLAALPSEHEDARQMIDAALRQLEQAKRAGGNCVRPAKTTGRAGE